MKGSITAYSIIELVIAGMVVLIGGFLISNLFGGLVDDNDESIFTIRDMASYTDSIKKNSCADFEFNLKQGYKIEHTSSKLNLIQEGKSEPLTSVSMKKKINIADNEYFNSFGNILPINKDYSKKIETRACICNDDGKIILSKMPYQYGIASGCSISDLPFIPELPIGGSSTEGSSTGPTDELLPVVPTGGAGGIMLV